MIHSSWKSDGLALLLLKTSSLASSWKVKNSDFRHPVHKKGGMIVPMPQAFPEISLNPQETVKFSFCQPFSFCYLDWNLSVHQGRGREWCILHMVACCSPLRLKQSMDHMDFCNVKFNENVLMLTTCNFWGYNFFPLQLSISLYSIKNKNEREKWINISRESPYGFNCHFNMHLGIIHFLIKKSNSSMTVALIG